MDEQSLINKLKQIRGIRDTSKKDLASIEACLKQAIRQAIRPIGEFLPVESSKTERSTIVPIGKNKDLQTRLKESKGLYLFYNSGGKVIYVGKTERRNLWDEIDSVFNSRRSRQKIKAFKPAFEEQGKRKKIPVRLFDIAAYFSAYSVHPSLIGNLETFLIRALPNNVVNIKIERFKY